MLVCVILVLLVTVYFKSSQCSLVTLRVFQFNNTSGRLEFSKVQTSGIDLNLSVEV